MHQKEGIVKLAREKKSLYIWIKFGKRLKIQENFAKRKTLDPFLLLAVLAGKTRTKFLN